MQFLDGATLKRLGTESLNNIRPSQVSQGIYMPQIIHHLFTYLASREICVNVEKFYLIDHNVDLFPKSKYVIS